MELSDQDFENLRGEIRRMCGLRIGDEKRYLIRQRLEPVAESFGCKSFAEFHRLLARNSNLTQRESVISAITTNETSFFRDGHPFLTFRQLILPSLAETIRLRKSLAGARKGPKVSILCAGASSGQEPYSLAMVVNDYLREHPGGGIAPDDFGIMAIDVSSRALAAAMGGRFSAFDLSRGMEPEYVTRYFEQKGDFWYVAPVVQAMVTFRKVNLIEPFTALGGFDVIFCRNVLIYFDEEMKGRILHQFHQMLTRDGFFFIGASENLINYSRLFTNLRYQGTVYFKPVHAA